MAPTAPPQFPVSAGRYGSAATAIIAVRSPGQGGESGRLQRGSHPGRGRGQGMQVKFRLGAWAGERQALMAQAHTGFVPAIIPIRLPFDQASVRNTAASGGRRGRPLIAWPGLCAKTPGALDENAGRRPPAVSRTKKWSATDPCCGYPQGKGAKARPLAPSPRRFPRYISRVASLARISARLILPLMVFGSSSTKSIIRGYL